MKIITWNCNMAFRKKADFILDDKPDILVVPECENPDKLLFSLYTPQPTDILWFGKNQHRGLNKGLAIFSYGDFRFKVFDNHNQDFQMVIPILATNHLIEINLFAIWANNPTDPNGQYVEQVWKAIHYYENSLLDTNTILVGDFNSNAIWDKKNQENNHSNIVKFLEDKGIFSTYHTHHNQKQGLEKDPTFYLYRHQNKPYHLDYCFASKNLLEKINSVEIGDFEHWTKYSDHVPLIVDFDL